MGWISVRLNLPITLAILAAELVSVAWYHYRQTHDRFLITALICDVGLAFVVHYILRHYWVFSGLKDGLQMGLAVGLLFFCLQAPHSVSGPSSLFNFLLHALHKALLVTVISCALYYGRKIKWGKSE